MSDLEARRKFEAALQEYVEHEYGPDHWLGDYIVAAAVSDMTEGAVPNATLYLHFDRGPFHARRGLVAEHEEKLLDEKLEEERES